MGCRLRLEPAQFIMVYSLESAASYNLAYCTPASGVLAAQMPNELHMPAALQNTKSCKIPDLSTQPGRRRPAPWSAEMLSYCALIARAEILAS